MNAVDSAWFFWAIGLAVGLPVVLISLTEWHQSLLRKQSHLAGPVNVLRSYLIPLGALMLLLTEVVQVSAHVTPVRVVATVFGFVVLVLLLSGLDATLFQSAPPGTWRQRMPTIFLDVARFLLIGIGLTIMFSYIWGVRVGGLFTALGVTSVVIGLMLQNSVGQIVSGLFLLFEQPFRIGDWLDTPAARGRVVEANWRAVHIQTGRGLQITPNSVLAGTSFTNMSRPPGGHQLTMTLRFSVIDPPEQVCALLSRVAGALPERKADVAPQSVMAGGGQYHVTVGLNSPADDGSAQSTFLRWIWYAARRERLHLDGARDDFSTAERLEQAFTAVVAPALRLSAAEQRALMAHARIVRYGAQEVLEAVGRVPTKMTFLVAGTVRMTAAGSADGSIISVGTLEAGSFLGLTTLTRQPNLADAYAVDEVTGLEVDRNHLVDLVMRKPLLLQEFGRMIDERRAKVHEATKVGKAAVREQTV